MTCAHVVHVALEKVAGVESVEVSLNQGLAIVKMKPGNRITVPQLWQIIHSQGYTPKATAVLVRGELTGTPGKAQLKVPETGEVIALAVDPKHADASAAADKQIGRAVVLRGVMNPGKDFKAAVPLQIEEVK
jgi:copper chaperone CopZ